MSRNRWRVKALSRLYGVDANILVRYLARDNEPQWKKAYSLIEAMDEGKIELLCDPVNLAEIVYVLGSTFGLERKQIHELLSPVMKATGFRMLNKDVYIQAMELYGDNVPHFGDACACATALNACEGRLLSFDKGLSSVPGVERLEKL